MAINPNRRSAVVVTGDLTTDWILSSNSNADQHSRTWQPDLQGRLVAQRGGAALLAGLVQTIADGIRERADFDVLQPPAFAPAPDDARLDHSYAFWTPFPYSTGAKNEPPAWRLARFLGLSRQTSPAGDLASVEHDSADAEIAILHDADLSFRSNRERWPACLTADGRRPWVILKMNHPVAKGPLWQWLHERCADRLIVVMTAADLRLTDAQISSGLSWERTAQDFTWEMQHNRGIRELADCAHVAVSFGAAGGCLYSREAEGAAACRLVFDPDAVEGSWEQAYEGGMVGYGSCIAAGIARQVMLAPASPDILEGLRAGLAGLRALHREGYGRGAGTVPAFPFRVVADAIATPDPVFQTAGIPLRAGEVPWTILGDRYRDGLAQTAHDVVLRGPDKALRGIPLGRFGALLTVDRQEIESLRSIRLLAAEYLAQPRPKRPLSIAVFGPPGAGKSFGITQLAMALKPGEIEVREFNLSQLRFPDGLLSALHQVRDIGLGGKIPLVFWDEFDTAAGGQALGWLRYFLAPMQDGKFQEGDLTHPIGRSLFVFAGGTSETLAGMGKGLSEDQIRAAKLPDFVSRLKGYLNVLGPNPRTGSDPYYLLRRAILLRSMLLRDARHLARNGELQIDPGVLRALLETRIYRHGARSMESFLAMSQLSGKTRFERSCLPPEAQLELHVDARDFLARVHQVEIAGELLEKMARAAHRLFCEELTSQGFRRGPHTDYEMRQHSSLVDYDSLPEDEKGQNRGQALDIPRKLAAAGCYIIPARGGEPVFSFSGEILERLACLEHARWMDQKTGDGWRYGPTTDKTARIHSDLLPWAELSEEAKEKDRAAVRNIAAILREGGFTVVEPWDRAAR